MSRRSRASSLVRNEGPSLGGFSGPEKVALLISGRKTVGIRMRGSKSRRLENNPLDFITVTRSRRVRY
ncbi:hypothetical protein EVAR_102652_1 [Eumeta japonica]|uniref:Uncharacterized protein n=1 Tax=Eumeta variegata TaxID=151549 RepID=A0A4C1TUS8_EUMVA|nr:hypothetical protein EVAR_102652_1 [Eumeta japonica]